MQSSAEWSAYNYAYLAARVARIHALLELHGTDAGDLGDSRLHVPALRSDLAPPALCALAGRAGLDTFEEDVLVLASAMELDSSTAARCAAANANARMDYPTLSLALAALPGAHWAALGDAGPLLRHRLVELAAGQGTMAARLSAPRRVWLHLLGLPGPDAALLQWASPVDRSSAPRAGPLREGARVLAEALFAHRHGRIPPTFQVSGPSRRDRATVIADALEETGITGFSIPLELLPADVEGQERLRATWRREAVLGPVALVLDGEAPPPSDPRAQIVHQLADVEGAVLIRSVQARQELGLRDVVCVDVRALSPDEQRAAWGAAVAASPALCPLGADGLPDLSTAMVIGAALAGTFQIDSGGIDAAVREAALSGPDATDAQAVLGAISEATRAAARPRLGGVATRVVPAATWEALVVPEHVRLQLRALVSSVRARAQVLDEWGMGRGGRGRGVTALLSGPSGVGKTMAAEVIAAELQMDLWRVDLATVVNKYVGETEKRLRDIFEAAEGGGAVLLFDEADALFGKRTQVRDAQDRYANITVSYLLQRIESFAGVTLLTTNLREAVDAAFLRRFRFVVEFPPPDQAAREELWRRAFPPSTPTRGLLPERLAQVPATGAVIRSIALRACLAAAAEGGEAAALEMRHLLAAAREEYKKARQPLTERETAGWLEG